MITVQFNSTFNTQLQRFALNIIFLHCSGLTDVFSANQHTEISACILSTQLAFSVQVKDLRYDFSTVFHSKETISENRSIGISVERTKSRTNLLALQKFLWRKKLTLNYLRDTARDLLLTWHFPWVTLPCPCSKAGNTSSWIQHEVSTSSSPSFIKLK